MGIGRDFERGYELDREGEAFVTGNPRRDGFTNPEMANDTRSTGLSGEAGEMDDILLSSESASDRDTHVGDYAGEAPSQDTRGDVTQIREGMRVFDRGGDELGSVDFVHFGDPQAATTQGEGIDLNPTLVEEFVTPITGGGDLDVPEPMRSQFLRMGYIKIDSKGWFAKDRYASMDEVASVSGDEVRLRVAKDQLVTS